MDKMQVIIVPGTQKLPAYWRFQKQLFTPVTQSRMRTLTCPSPTGDESGTVTADILTQLESSREDSTSVSLSRGTSLVAQWLRTRLPMQGTRVRALVWEDPTCHRATKPMRHNYWGCVLQLLKPVHLEPVLHNKRSHRNEKPVHRKEE